MDKSETYIKMCDCSEVQKLRGDSPHLHDFIYDPNYYDMWIKDCGWQENSIWLPRQDQIQEMLLNDIDLKWNIPKLFGNFQNFFGSNKNYERFDSFEKAWLAFYMSITHGKIWDGNKWL